MRKIIYILFFLFAFVFTFLFTFPASQVLGFLLTKNNVRYEKIGGNLFKVNISGIKVKNLKIPEITLKNRFPYIYAILNKNNFVKFNILSKSGKINFEKLKIQEFIKNSKISGNLSLNEEFILKLPNVLFKGNGEIFILKEKYLGLSNIRVNFKNDYDKEKTRIKASLSGRNITGEFNGSLKVLVSGAVKLKGNFKGNVFGGKIDKNINISLGL